MLNALAHIFVFGSIWWWLVTLIAVIWVFISVEYARFMQAGICISIYLFISNIAFDGILPLKFMGAWGVLVSFIGYGVIGIGWSYIKWYSYVKKEAKEYVDNRKFDSNYVGGGSLNEESFMSNSLSDMKERIVTWIMYWPISLLWFFLDDFVKKIAHKIYDLLKNSYTKIAGKIFHNVLNDITKGKG